MYFDKISYKQWATDVPMQGVPFEVLKMWHNDIKLPQQGTEYSAGVDFSMPYTVKVLPHNKVKIPTGIRWVCDNEADKYYGMLIVPRSSIGIKNGLRLLNTVGVIDSDYYKADNEGHIMLFFENTTDETITLIKGRGVAQGIIVPCAIPDCAKSDADRHGGFGSTDT